MENSKVFPKIRINALIDRKAYKKMQQEVQKRYITDKKVTMSSLTNEIILAHYHILKLWKTSIKAFLKQTLAYLKMKNLII